jgi:hypothetical protein
VYEFNTVDQADLFADPTETWYVNVHAAGAGGAGLMRGVVDPLRHMDECCRATNGRCASADNACGDSDIALVMHDDDPGPPPQALLSENLQANLDEMNSLIAGELAAKD